MSEQQQQRGFTLIEVILVSSLFLVVLTATMTAMTSFERVNRDNQRTNDQTERTRRSVERGMRQLRNLASRTMGSTATIGRAEPYDFYFQTSDPTRTWVRYCREDVGNGKSRMWSLANPANTAATTTSCPGTTTEWPKRDLVATNVTNTANGRTIPLFTYGRKCTVTSSATCATDTSSITSVRMDILVDDDLARTPAEVRVSSGVYLRNQNEFPVAAFTSGPAAQARQVTLNASSASDPEGRTLRYRWFLTPAPAVPCGELPPDGTLLGQSVTLNYTFPAAAGAAGSTVDFTLVVCDPGDLQHSVTQPVIIP